MLMLDPEVLMTANPMEFHMFKWINFKVYKIPQWICLKNTHSKIIITLRGGLLFQKIALFCVYKCLLVYYVHVWYQQRPREFIRSPGTVVSDSYELPCVLETEHDSSGRALSALKHWVTSRIPRMITFYVEIQNSFTMGLTSSIQKQELWKEAEDQKIQRNQT